jgi:lysophospholipase L1-like esterase
MTANTLLGAAILTLLACSSTEEPAPSGSGGRLQGGADAGGANAGSAGAPVAGSAIGGAAAGGSSLSGGASSGGALAGSGPAAGYGGSGGAAGSSGAAGSGGVSGTLPVTVWIAGDSTVQNCNAACPCGWGGQFDALFDEQVKVVNSAVGGRSIQTWLYESAVGSSAGADGECTLSSDAYHQRWSAMLDAASGMKTGDYLFIQFGINDGDSKCPRHVGTALFKEYLGVMAQAAKARGAQPVFLTPVSAIACQGSDAVGSRGFLTAVAEAAQAENVPVIDLHERSVALYDTLGFCPTNGNYSAGALGAFFCNDHTHFEAAGAAEIAKLVAQALHEQGLSLAAHLD